MNIVSFFLSLLMVAVVASVVSASIVISLSFCQENTGAHRHVRSTHKRSSARLHGKRLRGYISGMWVDSGHKVVSFWFLLSKVDIGHKDTKNCL